MKRIITIVLACTLFLTACTPATDINVVDVPQATEIEQTDNQADENET